MVTFAVATTFKTAVGLSDMRSLQYNCLFNQWRAAGDCSRTLDNGSCSPALSSLTLGHEVLACYSPWIESAQSKLTAGRNESNHHYLTHFFYRQVRTLYCLSIKRHFSLQGLREGENREWRRGLRGTRWFKGSWPELGKEWGCGKSWVWLTPQGHLTAHDWDCLCWIISSPGLQKGYCQEQGSGDHR